MLKISVVFKIYFQLPGSLDKIAAWCKISIAATRCKQVAEIHTWVPLQRLPYVYAWTFRLEK